MYDIFIETSPNPFSKKVTDEDGWTKGIIHNSRTCPSIVGIVFPTFDTDRSHYRIKVGRGAWISVKKDVRCDHCYPEDYNKGVTDGEAQAG